MRGEEERFGSQLLLRCEIEEDMFCADCYLSVISAFLSVTMTEPEQSRGAEKGDERGERKKSGQQSSRPQTGNVSLRMPQLLCLALVAVTVKSKQHE